MPNSLPTPLEAFARAAGPLEEVFGQRTRLGIMASVVGAGEISFLALKEALCLSDGNLSSHLTYLEKHGMVEVQKSFQGKRPFTSVLPTDKGREALASYLNALENLIARLREQ